MRDDDPVDVLAARFLGGDDEAADVLCERLDADPSAPSMLQFGEHGQYNLRTLLKPRDIPVALDLQWEFLSRQVAAARDSYARWSKDQAAA